VPIDDEPWYGNGAPRLAPGVDVLALPLTPADGYVLSRVDGVMAAHVIVGTSGLGDQLTTASLRRLTELGAILWPGQPERPRPTAEPTTRVHTSKPASAAPSAAATVPPADGRPRLPSWVRRPPTDHKPVPATATAPPPADGVELAIDARERIDRVFSRLDEMTYYEVLEVSADASRRDLRDAYFRLSKAFHPDTKYGKELGLFKPKMEAIFRRLTEAYDTLRVRSSRAAYDASLAAWRAGGEP
jgi:hypothetical protein